MIKGVVSVTPGYAGGKTENPTYNQVSMGDTGHAEVILVEYDPFIISFKTLLDVFFASHDPTAVNRQGNDAGTQYRSIILYQTDAQANEVTEQIKNLIESKKYPSPIATEIVPLGKFYPAEEYHQQYFAHHPNEGYSQVVIAPKVEKIKNKYHDLLK